MEEDVSNAALDSRVRDQYSSLSAICGKYLAIKAEIEMAMMEKSPKISMHIKSLEVVMHSLKTLKTSMSPAFASPLSLFQDKLKKMMDSAAELNAFLTSIEEIKNDLVEINPVDIVSFYKYTIVPLKVFDILKAFLLVLQKDHLTLQRWWDVRNEVSGYNRVTNHLAQAKKYSPVVLNMLNIIEARYLCDPYLSLINVDEDSSSEQLTLAIILKWVLLMVNESTVHYKEHGGDLEKALTEFEVCVTLSLAPFSLQ
ncbi:hypothetical protein EB796_000978 [Bugula neritina]|uniref:Uncharacterized protein n=1 Tax=Bugula neritina TaxID=10212 RepID=A0A7J7KR87_BUGNE|nr:hypothetical protein EB796_000978 [Bugula neritina]